jgi:hypothetical protein
MIIMGELEQFVRSNCSALRKPSGFSKLEKLICKFETAIIY